MAKDKGTDTSRRKFIGGVATGAAVLSTKAPAEIPSSDEVSWDAEVDILVVGGGAAGCSAALTANELGNRVMIVEKGPVLGGTAAKSIGGIWAPANRLMSAAGLTDSRDDCLKYMIRLSFADNFNPEAKYYGASPMAYRQLSVFYDYADHALAELERYARLKLIILVGPDGFMPDYYGHLPENKTPTGRTLVVAKADGSIGYGAEMMRQFSTALNEKRIPVKKRHRGKELLKDANGRVIGAVVEKRDGSLIRIKADKGVIFATGGFTHNVEMRRDFLKGPVFGGCAIPSCEGDFIPIATAAGAQLGNMANAWWAQLPLEQALENPSVPSGIWCSPGDSMIQVNRFGKRFCNEKFVYNERTQSHFYWDPVSGSYSNLVSLMIFDQRTREQFAGFAPIPPLDLDLDHVMSGETLPKLVQKIRQRLADLAKHTGAYQLDEEFETELTHSIKRYNQFARQGIDQDFNRGEQAIDKFFHFFGPGKPQNDLPNVTMHPIKHDGPLYAVILAAGTLDTKGGPKTNEFAQVLNADGEPIPGLYGAGNCVASCTGPAYWAGGATLGPALTFGLIAAHHANNSSLAQSIAKSA